MSTHSHDGKNYLNHEKGIWSWLTTIDHKRIGLMYLFTILFFFLIGGIFAMMIRMELFKPGLTLMDANTYNKVFTYHGVIMVFMVIIPAVPAALGNFVLPMMLGAKDVAFPKLNLASYYFYIIGAAVAVLTLFFGQVDTGWTFYAPYSIKRLKTPLPSTPIEFATTRWRGERPLAFLPLMSKEKERADDDDDDDDDGLL